MLTMKQGMLAIVVYVLIAIYLFGLAYCCRGCSCGENMSSAQFATNCHSFLP